MIKGRLKALCAVGGSKPADNCLWDVWKERGIEDDEQVRFHTQTSSAVRLIQPLWLNIYIDK